ncbi:hypothetical protein [Herpetosiphon geysericola]|uniref:Uncharacterized protein n=1 Tax=Herpetosiphon geysericola TaxID=70996 RepID=A0A0P6XCJ8_9CHLR|nr:hypothetical protein [Herpetosiphon geysericola]KPL80215.1 hypothetical protein SE18_24475 [Herpetosiphon geysericola]
MIESLLCTIAAAASAVAASFIIRNRTHQLIVVVIASLFWFAVWCVLIEPMYLLFAVFAGWLTLVVGLSSLFMGMAKHLAALKHEHQRPMISTPLTQEDIDKQ